MTFDVRWVRYGRPAAEALRKAISQAKGDEPLNPVTVLVPSNHVGVAARRMLASGKLGPICNRGAGIVAVDFLTPYRLAELLGAARLAGTAGGRYPLRSLPQRCGPASTRTPACSGRSPRTRQPSRHWSTPTGSCATCPPTPWMRWPPRAPGPTR